MKKIFIDTNIFLDLILKRKDYREAIIIFNAVAEDIFQGYLLDITILNIDYVAIKQVKDIREFLYTINQNFTVVGATNRLINQALDIQNNDLEDNLQYISAKENRCDLIITNDKNFYSQKMETISSVAFVAKYI